MLAELAAAYDRQFDRVNAWSTGVTADVVIGLDDTEAREKLRRLVEGETSDFDPATHVSWWGKAAGLYAGVGIAADAMRYAVLRDEGAPCDEVEEARGQLLKGLRALRIALEITGAPGVLARGFIRTDLTGAESYEPVPLFDDQGQPLPVEKNNGTWRADASGKHPDLIWEDSCSRDMILGWAMAYGVAWEVVAKDSSISDDVRRGLSEDAAAVARELMKVRDSGYDLEIPDADGRTTFHGYLNENAFERSYLPGVRNGFHALMALGIVSSLAQAAQAPDVTAWLNDALIEDRSLPEIAADGISAIYMGEQTNGSNVNMAFTAMWLAYRYAPDDDTRLVLGRALEEKLYDNQRSETWRASTLGQALFDFIHASHTRDAQSIARGVASLSGFPAPPYFARGRLNCDEHEAQAGVCTLDDGSQVTLTGVGGRFDELLSATPLPMSVRPPSNYWWRSNPYVVNGEADGTSLHSGVDFRIAYWMGRFVRR